jgi:WS/DGAT/MGAT family acyltransferase
MPRLGRLDADATKRRVIAAVETRYAPGKIRILQMAHRERLSAVDTAWLRMDRPANLMMIVAVWMLQGPVAIDRVESQLTRGFILYPRFRQKIEPTPAGVFWRDDPNFDLTHHLKRVRLPGSGGKRALERFVGDLASDPLDPVHPLWQIHIVEDYEGGAAVVFRIHHAIADGIALVGVTMSLVDDARRTEAVAPDAEEGWIETLLAPVVSAIAAGAETSTSILGAAFHLVRNPLRAAGYLRTGVGVVGELGYLLLMPSDSTTRFKGKPIGVKRVAWSEPLKLPDVKAVSRALGASINDVLLACVAGAMRRYLEEKGDPTRSVECRALVPINLRQPGDLELGNRFGIVAVELPVGVEDPLDRLRTVRQRMLALKTSLEPAVTLGLFAALGRLPQIVQDQLFDILLSRATAVMTNVPGPQEPLSVAGSVLKQSMFWVPQTGDIGMGVSILTYAGKVQFGLITDAALTPDPEAIVARFADQFETYLYWVLLDPPAIETAAAPAP